VQRYGYEAQRHWDIVNARLGKHRYMLGDTYTLVDMALWGWARLRRMCWVTKVGAS